MTKPRTQYGALPFRIADGKVEVLLTTSRDTKRWIIPKGWPMPGKTPHRCAAREAFEEAGIKGEIGRFPLGSYDYDKRLKDNAVVPCRVEVFPLHVAQERRRWPEHAQRERAWFQPDLAAAAVAEKELAQIILAFADLADASV